jgi:hypothetical protein
MPDSSTALILGVFNETNNQYESIFNEDDEPKSYEADDIEYLAYDHLSSLIQQSDISINRTDDQLKQAAKNYIKIEVQIWKMLKGAGSYKQWEIEYDRTGNFLELINLPLTKVRFEKLEEILPIVSFHSKCYAVKSFFSSTCTTSPIMYRSYRNCVPNF